MILRLLNWQGIAGMAVAIGLLGLLVAQSLDARHWHKSSDRFEQLYTQEQLAFATTTAAYREATESARASDRANAARVTAEQQTINERTQDDFQTRIADARATAARLAAGSLRQEPAAGAADPGGRRTAAVPGLPAAAGGAAEAAGQVELPAGDALTATEQAIQLDELIAWVRRQAAVDPNRASGVNVAPTGEPVHP